MRPSIALACFASLASVTACTGLDPAEESAATPPDGGAPEALLPQQLSFAVAGPAVLEVGQTLANAASAPGSGAITYRSSDPDLATVDAAGVVKALAAGGAVITANIESDTRYEAASASFTVEVERLPQSLRFSEAGPMALLVGESAENAATSDVPGSEIVYSSSDPQVATVDAEGRIEAVSSGRVEISATALQTGQHESAEARYHIEVSLRPQTLAFENAGPLSLTALDSSTNAAAGEGSGAIHYASSDPTVAVVDDLGQVRALTAGSAEITATIDADDRFDAATASFLVEIERRSQTLTLVLPGPFELFTGESLNNAAVGEGTGAIRYESSDETAATVADDGTLTARGGGRVTILARIAADSVYAGATASFEVQVVPEQLTFVAWVGERDTHIEFPPAVAGVELNREATVPCEDAEITGCIHSESDVVVADMPVVDTTFNTERSARFEFAFAGRTATTTLSHARPENLWDHQVTVFQDRLWFVSGNYAGKQVWSSEDGVNWELATDAPSFRVRTSFRLVTFQGRMWVIGGDDNGRELNRVWSSEDGVTWTEVPQQAPFTARDAHGLAVYDGRIWIAGGWNGRHALNDVWSSEDGANWVLETESAPFAPRSLHELLAHDGRLFVVGGGGEGLLDDIDVWSSTNGRDWTPATAMGGLSPLHSFSGASHGGRLWAIAGWADDHVNRVWSSPDGGNWDESPVPVPFAPREDSDMVVFRDRLWLVGGHRGSDGALDDVWSSADGVRWRHEHSGPSFSRRAFSAGTVHNGEMVIGGGWLANHFSSDLWRSRDGIHWEAFPSDGSTPTARADALLSQNGRLWVIQGYRPQSPSALWSSADGTQWERHSEETPGSDRLSRSYAAFDGRLWIIGGRSFEGLFNDVWSSEDGAHWTEVTAGAAFSPRQGHEVAVWRNRMWLVGGNDGSNTNEVWSSADGETWEPELHDDTLPNLNGHALLVKDDRLYVVRGNGRSYFTEDGRSWQPGRETRAFPGRGWGLDLSLNGAFYKIGGLPNGSSSLPLHEVWRSTDGVNWRLGHRGRVRF